MGFDNYRTDWLPVRRVQASGVGCTGLYEKTEDVKRFGIVIF